MTKIIGISGRKQAGKNTCANYIVGDVLKQKNMVKDFEINNDGQLTINTINANGKEGWGIFDVLRKDDLFVEYADRELWPYVKIYHFADSLKNICVKLFGMSLEQAYGTDEDKNTNTDMLWENMPENHNNQTGYITARDFMQHFGTNIIRKMKDSAWVDATISLINNEESQVAIIPDVRFPNEVNAIHKAGGIVIRLTRNIHNSDHRCETALDPDVFGWEQFDFILDNNERSIKHLSEELSKLSRIWSI